MKQNPSKSASRGFTMVEVITAVIIFGLVAVGGMSFFFYGRAQIDRAARERQAVEIGRQKVEELKVTPYDNIITRIETGIPMGATTAVRTTTVTPVVSGSVNYKVISVHVQWPASNPNNDLWLHTLIAAPLS